MLRLCPFGRRVRARYCNPLSQSIASFVGRETTCATHSARAVAARHAVRMGGAGPIVHTPAARCRRFQMASVSARPGPRGDRRPRRQQSPLRLDLREERDNRRFRADARLPLRGTTDAAGARQPEQVSPAAVAALVERSLTATPATRASRFAPRAPRYSWRGGGRAICGYHHCRADAAVDAAGLDQYESQASVRRSRAAGGASSSPSTPPTIADVVARDLRRLLTAFRWRSSSWRRCSKAPVRRADPRPAST